MSKFALIRIEAVNGKQKFYKLEKDGTCEFDEFEKKAKENYNSQMNSIYHRMDALSERKRLPKTQFKILEGGFDGITECEIKTKNLRIYYFIDGVNGNIVVLGGYKTKQKKDIIRFRSNIKQYMDYKRRTK